MFTRYLSDILEQVNTFFKSDNYKEFWRTCNRLGNKLKPIFSQKQQENHQLLLKNH